MSLDNGLMELAVASAVGHEQAAADLALRLRLPLQQADSPLAELLPCG